MGGRQVIVVMAVREGKDGRGALTDSVLESNISDFQWGEERGRIRRKCRASRGRLDWGEVRGVWRGCGLWRHV
jgi:hypothetical protein